MKSQLEANSSIGTVPEVRSETRTLARGALVSTLGNVSGGLMNAVGQVYIARQLGPQIYGFYALGLVLLNLMRPFANFGLGRMAVAFGAEFWKVDDSRMARVLRFALQWSAFFSIFFALGLFLLAQPIAVGILKVPADIATIRIFALIIPLQALMDIGNSISTITREAKYSVFSQQLLQPAASLFLIVLFVSLGWGYSGVMAASVASYVAAMGLALWFALRLFPEIRQVRPAGQPATRELLFFSFGIILPSIFSTMIIWGDRLVLSALLPVAAVGVYQSASQFSILFAMILGAVNAVYSPMIAAFYKKGETRKLDELYKVTTKWAFFLSLPVCVVTLIVPRLVLTVIFGTAYGTGALPLQILTIGQLINVATGAVGMLLMMTGHARAWSVSPALALFFSVGLNLLLSPHLGIAGAAIGTTVAMGVMFGTGILQVKHYLHIWPYDRRYWKGLLAAAGSTLVVAGLSMVSFPTPFLKLFLISSGSLTVFILIILLLKLDAEDLDILRVFVSRFTRGR